jgi:hypothetical protein
MPNHCPICSKEHGSYEFKNQGLLNYAYISSKKAVEEFLKNERENFLEELSLIEQPAYRPHQKCFKDFSITSLSPNYPEALDYFLRNNLLTKDSVAEKDIDGSLVLFNRPDIGRVYINSPLIVINFTYKPIPENTNIKELELDLSPIYQGVLLRAIPPVEGKLSFAIKRTDLIRMCGGYSKTKGNQHNLNLLIKYS